MNLDSIIAPFKQRALQVDFLEMSLVQNTESEGAISTEGRGTFGRPKRMF
jgi:hypothetical protein